MRIWATEKEKKDMQLVHKKAIEQMEGLFLALGLIKREAALEIGCGDCLVSKDFLRRYFAHIDLLDQCEEAGKEMRSFQWSCKKVRHLFLTPMQNFSTPLRYNCIVLRYSIGYLEDDDAVTFLKKLGGMLSSEKQKARAAARSSFILIQDQVISEKLSEYQAENQKVRRLSSFERIIKAAGLIIVKKSDLEQLDSKVWPVIAMALSPSSA